MLKATKGTQHNNTQHNDTQYNGLICDTQNNDTQHNVNITTLSINDTQLSSIECHYAQNHVFCYAWRHYAKCRMLNVIILSVVAPTKRQLSGVYTCVHAVYFVTIAIGSDLKKLGILVLKLIW